MSWFDGDSHDNKNYAPATEGGSSYLEINNDKGILKVGLKQPENTKDNATMRIIITPQEKREHYRDIHTTHPDPPGGVSEIDMSDGSIITIETNIGASNELEYNEDKSTDYSLFMWIGAGCFVIGIIVTVLSFTALKVVVPIWVGPGIMATGAATAYMSEAIPKYGPWFLLLLVLVGAGYGIHHFALRKDAPNKMLK